MKKIKKQERIITILYLIPVYFILLVSYCMFIVGGISGGYFLVSLADNFTTIETLRLSFVIFLSCLVVSVMLHNYAIDCGKDIISVELEDEE